LINLELPDLFLDEFPGPNYGVENIQKFFPKCKNVPVGAILKPRPGLKPALEL
jgi:ribulose 1,5-bisphosphate carboxylase large subunit-like protein